MRVKGLIFILIIEREKKIEQYELYVYFYNRGNFDIFKVVF